MEMMGIDELVESVFTRKHAEQVKVDDEFNLGGLHFKVTKVRVNSKDEMVYDLEIVNQTVKKRKNAMLIIPKQNVIETFKK